MQPLLISKKSQELVGGLPKHEDLLLFPFTEQEKHSVTDSFLDQFKYQVEAASVSLNTPGKRHQQQDMSHVKYQTFLDSCAFRQRQYGDLLKQSDSIISDLRQLTLSYDTVSHDTETFQSEANSLIAQVEKYSALKEEIQNTLNVYERLDPITRRLNNPNPNIVRKSSFHDLLVELDSCLSFLKANQDHKESAVYEARFKRCQVRALTMVRNYVIAQVRSVGQEITKKLSQGTTVNDITRDALIYTRFTEDLQGIKDITSDLCSRFQDDSEYENLFNDCLHAYYGVRYSLIQAVIRAHFNVNDSMTSLTQFTQNNITFLERLFQSEAEVYSSVFSRQSGSLTLSSWFGELAEPLYDSLRHRVLRESSIGNLCGLISLLERYYEYDEEELELLQLGNGDLDLDPKALPGQQLPPQQQQQQQLQGYKMSEVLLPILQDTQTRLIFRIQNYTANEIAHYKPQAADFQISQRKNAASSSSNSSCSTSEISHSAIPSFPPLDKALILLSKIHGHIPSQVFTSLTHTIAHDLINALLVTSKPFVTKYIGRIEGEVWLMRELLRFNQSLSQYEFGFEGDMSGFQGDMDTVIDFSGTVNFIRGIISNVPQQDAAASRSRKSSAWEILSDTIPKVKTEYRDSRIELQTALATVVESFDSEAVQLIMKSISPSSSAAADAVDWDEKMMTLRDTIKLTYQHLYDLIKVYIPSRDLDPDHIILSSLIDSVGPLVTKAYENWFNTNSSSTGGNGVNIMDVDSVTGFIEGVVLSVGKKEEAEAEAEGEEENPVGNLS